MREKGAQWLVTLESCTTGRGDKFPQPVSHSESHLVGPFGPFLTLFGHLGAGQWLQVGPEPL